MDDDEAITYWIMKIHNTYLGFAEYFYFWNVCCSFCCEIFVSKYELTIPSWLAC